MNGPTANFEGHTPRECGEHRTVGPHRAWCYDCGEWCYPDPEMACARCELAALRAHIKQLRQQIAAGPVSGELPEESTEEPEAVRFPGLGFFGPFADSSATARWSRQTGS